MVKEKVSEKRTLKNTSSKDKSVRGSKAKSVKRKVDTPKIKKSSEKSTKKVRKKIRVKQEEIKESFFDKIICKNTIIYLLLLIIDIILIVYVADMNYINYVDMGGTTKLISNTNQVLFGRNYITLVITGFFYLYTCILRHVFFQKKNTMGFLVGLFIFLMIINEALFVILSNKVY